MPDLRIETIEETTRWTVVMEGEREVFRAPKQGHTKAAWAKCERWIGGQSKDIAFYRNSAARTDAANEFVKSLEGTHPPGTISHRRRRR